MSLHTPPNTEPDCYHASTLTICHFLLFLPSKYINVYMPYSKEAWGCILWKPEVHIGKYRYRYRSCFLSLSLSIPAPRSRSPPSLDATRSLWQNDFAVMHWINMRSKNHATGFYIQLPFPVSTDSQFMEYKTGPMAELIFVSLKNTGLTWKSFAIWQLLTLWEYIRKWKWSLLNCYHCKYCYHYHTTLL